MQISDILRKVADIVDQAEEVSADAEAMPAEHPGEEGTVDVKIAQLEPVDVNNDDGSEGASMVSPLQQEHELLKKSQGVDNHADAIADQTAQTEAEVNPTVEEPKESRASDEDEWSSAMGHDQDDPEEMIGQPDDDDDLEEMKRLAGIGKEQPSRDVSGNLGPAGLNPRANAALEANGKEHLKHTQRKDF